MTPDLLKELYIEHKKSVASIAKKFNCSQNKVNYWLKKHKIKKRSISDAIYNLRNPLGDPFTFQDPINLQESFLYGLGLGLYWGEGAKRGNGGVRLANTDIKLVKKFIEFLEKFFRIDRNRLRFGLQIFNDLSPEKCLLYWRKGLGVKKDQFYKIIVSKVRGEGTYKYKSEYGVLIVYFNNTRLKKSICEMIENI